LVLYWTCLVGLWKLSSCGLWHTANTDDRDKIRFFCFYTQSKFFSTPKFYILLMFKSCIFFLLSCLACYQTSIAQKPKPNRNLLQVASPTGYEGNKLKDLEVNGSFHFLVVGDWGRNGQFNQQPVADRMGEAAEQLDANLVISTGDNFYPNGVASTQDPAWQSSFENIYTTHSLMCDWYAVLGNHDYRGNAQAQIDYTSLSRRWRMPARYYAIERVFDRKTGEKALFMFLDTNPFDPSLDAERHTDLYKQDTAAQKKWIEQTLANSTAKWKIVVGHHPLYTTGARLGKTQDIINAFDYVLEKHKVDIYFAGHEHDLQHQKPQDKNVNHFVSGAGSEIRPVSKTTMTVFSKSAHGFMAVSLQQTQAMVQVIDEKGNILHKTIIKK
jgi:tartrate-resistant acid phosphatase type 5